MSSNTPGDIIDDYVNYLHSDLRASAYDETVIVETPFTLPGGRVLRLAIEPDPEGESDYVLLSDYGAVADFFIHHGQELSEDERLVGKIAKRADYYGVVLVNEILEVRTPRKYIPENLNELAQAAIAAAAVWEHSTAPLRPLAFRERVRDAVNEIDVELEEGFGIRGVCEVHEFPFGGRQNGRLVALSILSATQGGQAKEDRKVICWEISDTIARVNLVPAVIVDDTTDERKRAAQKAELGALEKLQAKTYWWSEMVQAEWEPLEQYLVDVE